MILYTIYDPNVIFNNGVYSDQQIKPNYLEMNINGTMVQISQANGEEVQVERIISTNPADYLNPKLQPGCIIKR